MVSSDTVVGIVGAVILTGAMIAVFYYENTNAENGGDDGLIGEGSQTFTFTYAQANATAVDGTSPTISGTGDATAEEITFDLPAYVFDIHAVVTWSDDDDAPLPSGEDTLKVELINEAGTALETDEQATGEIELQHGHGPEDNLTTPPRQTVVVAAENEDDARATLANATADGHGVGTWTLKVTLTSTGDRAGAAQTDTTQDFTATVTYSYWDPQLQN